MYVSLNSNDVIDAVSQQPLNIKGKKTLKIDLNMDASQLIGKRLVTGPKKEPEQLRVAVVCNWGDRCGIATYTGFLINALRPLVQEIRIFAEYSELAKEEEGVVRCWKRGESMIAAVQQVLAWGPDLVFIQHEFGIFPKAIHFLKMLEMLDQTPYVMTFHSVYEHLDKTVCTAYVKNMIVHSNKAKESLQRLGHSGAVYVLPHGCVIYENTDSLWNIFQNPYTIIQFGFGFEYKGVDVAIEAVKKLKDNDPKFKDIFYCYMCSESLHTRSLQERYYQQIRERVKAYGLEENVVVLRGYLAEQHLCNFMRTAKLAIFPYKNNPTNVVYGASGAIRKAMANGIPIIASESHMFDDLDGVVPRPSDSDTLAMEIDKIFSSKEYRDCLVQSNLRFVRDNNWEAVAARHLDVFSDVISRNESSMVRVEIVDA